MTLQVEGLERKKVRSLAVGVGDSPLQSKLGTKEQYTAYGSSREVVKPSKGLSMLRGARGSILLYLISGVEG